MTPLSFRPAALLGLVALAAVVPGFGFWAALTPLAGAIVAQGRVEVEDHRQVVQHPDGGVVAAILVAEGDAVRAGQVLIRLDRAALESELAIVELRLQDLAAQRARLLAERDGLTAPTFPPGPTAEAERRLFQARLATLRENRAQLDRRIDQARAEGEGIAAQRAAVALQAGLIDRERAIQRDLQARGLAASATVLALEREAARLEGQLGELAAALARAGGQAVEVEIQRSTLETLRREEAAARLREIGPEVMELTERRRVLRQRIDRLELRAPVSGVVLGLQLTTPGAVLRPAEPVLHIVPQDRPLVIAARIPPIHIDEVDPGQPVDLVPTALAGRDRPRLSGRVALVSADALSDPQTGAAYYLAEVVPDPGPAPPLRPGMPVEVYLQTGSRTPLAYLIAPFAAYFHRAFRES